MNGSEAPTNSSSSRFHLTMATADSAQSTNALKQLKALGGDVSVSDNKGKDTPSKKAKASVTDCCICLFSVTVCQSLFIA